MANISGCQPPLHHRTTSRQQLPHQLQPLQSRPFCLTSLPANTPLHPYNSFLQTPMLVISSSFLPPRPHCGHLNGKQVVVWALGPACPAAPALELQYPWCGSHSWQFLSWGRARIIHRTENSALLQLVRKDGVKRFKMLP